MGWQRLDDNFSLANHLIYQHANMALAQRNKQRWMMQRQGWRRAMQSPVG